MKKLKLFICILMMMVLFSGCTKLQRNIITNEVTNKVENNITQHLTTYDGLENITSVEDAIKVCIKKVENSVLGVSLKQVTKSVIKDVEVTFEDTLSVGSGVIYKRIENYNEDHELTSYTYYVYTNAHVITPEASSTTEAIAHKVYVYLGYDNLEIEATILGSDEKLDVACLKFDSYLYFEPVEVGNSDELEKGRFVIVVGNPDGYEYYGSATFGIVSNTGRYLNFDTDGDNVNDYAGEFIQTDCAINPGNSGGGMFTLDGKFVGIPSVKLTSVKIDNMGFVIPSNLVTYACSTYLEQGLTIQRPRLGITCIACKDLTSKYMIENNIPGLPNIYDGANPYGIYISGFGKNGSLVNQGFNVGDIILAIDGDKLYSNNDISAKLNSLINYQVGSKCEFTYYCSTTKTIKTVLITLTTGD